MKILLDTHILIWSLIDSPKLTDKARKLIFSADEVYTSTVNIWEIVIKSSTGKLRLNLNKIDLINIIKESGFKLLNILPEHAIKLLELENFHNDPFDRMLIAQSLVEPIHLITSDIKITQYNANIIKI